MARGTRGWIACIAALPWIGCASPGSLFGPAHCEGRVAREGPFEARRIHLRAALLHGGASRRYEAVLELGPEGAALVGLTPFGTRAFSVRPHEDGLRVDNRVGRYLGQSPRLLWDAVARAWLAPALRNVAPLRVERAQERIVWRDGERVFLPLGAADAEPGARVAWAADATRVTSRWCRYEAQLLVVSDSLAAPTAPARPPDGGR